MDEMLMESYEGEDEAKSNESDVVEPRIRDVWHASQETCMGFGARLAACASLRLPPPFFPIKSFPLHFPGSSFFLLHMDWLHKMKRAWLAVSARIRPRKSGGSSVGSLGGGGSCNGDYGLLKLRDDVRTCTYQDVQVMWNMLSGSQANDVSSAKSVAQPLHLESSKQRRVSWRLVFWSNRR
ncbi:hypothetical protein FH972_013397 [Carpinus fangiana]|uniref:Uncharacterized protein n=1 Tax=Carpinus fangiana TaxID=176857 RepID=A0A5N6R6M8_9ROSI|nr:hypothetical protein FH972_013397 [Carpinus fangiana]